MKNLSNIVGGESSIVNRRIWKLYSYWPVKEALIDELDPPFEGFWELLYIIRFHTAEIIEED